MWGTKKKKQVVYPSIYKDRYKELIEQTIGVIDSMHLSIDLLEFKMIKLKEIINQKY
jgi:hypothetical protein